MPLIPRILTPDDTRALQRSLKDGVVETDAAVQACTLDAATTMAWGQYRDSVLAYAAVPVSGFGPDFAATVLAPAVGLIFGGKHGIFGNSTEAFYATGKAYEVELVDWQKKITGVGCPIAVLHQIPQEEESGLEKALKWGAIAAGVLGGAWVLSEIVPVVVAGVAEMKAARRLGGANRSGSERERTKVRA